MRRSSARKRIALVFLAFIGLVLWHDSKTSRLSPEERRPQAVALAQESSRAPASVARLPGAGEPGRSLRVETPSQRADLFAGARLISSAQTAPDEQGAFERIRVVYADGYKYPLVRVLDRYQNGNYLGQRAMAADHVLVALQPGMSQDDLEQLANQYDAHILQATPAGHFLVSFDGKDPMALDALVQKFTNRADVIKVTEPDYVIHLDP